MSEMTITNKKLMLAGLYLSKFDRGKQGLKALGFKTLQEAYNSFALAVGGRPASVKNYMQEFDPYFPNSRISTALQKSCNGISVTTKEWLAIL